jgi:membrane dipeptidase
MELLLALAGLIATAPVPAGAPTPADADLHRRAIVVDTHSDSTQKIEEGRDFAKPQPDMQEDLPKMKKGGLDAQFFSIWVDPEKFGRADYFSESMRQLDAVHKMIAANAKSIAWAQTAADVRRNDGRGLLSALFGVEGGHSLLPGTETEQLQHLRTLFERGARYMTLTWMNSNPIGGSSGDEGETQGLTDFGRRVIDEMHRLGMVVDLSHVSDPLFCVNFYSGYLDDAFEDHVRPLWNKSKGLPLLEREKMIQRELGQVPGVPLSTLVDHIDHIAKTAGVDHVCLGSDFDGIPALPVGLEDASKLPALTQALRARGYSADEVRKILGENTLRVLQANEPIRSTP